MLLLFVLWFDNGRVVVCCYVRVVICCCGLLLWCVISVYFRPVNRCQNKSGKVRMCAEKSFVVVVCHCGLLLWFVDDVRVVV